jgi:dTDP-4-dehydrorhamnose reductase
MLQNKNDIPLFSDQYITPSRAGQVANTTLALLERESTGLFNIASRSCTTPYKFGKLLCGLADGDEGLIHSASVSEFDQPARRPRYSCLDVTKVEQQLGRSQPTLVEDLEAISRSFSDYNL